MEQLEDPQHPLESRGVTNASPEQGQGPQAACPPHAFDKKTCPSHSLQERHRGPSHHWQFKGLETDPGNKEASE